VSAAELEALRAELAAQAERLGRLEAFIEGFTAGVTGRATARRYLGREPLAQRVRALFEVNREAMFTTGDVYHELGALDAQARTLIRSHLSKMTAAGVLERVAQGRYRYRNGRQP